MTVTAAEARDLALKKLSGREPVSGEYPVRLSSDAVEALVRAQQQLIEAEETDPDDTAALDKARAALVRAQEVLDEATVVCTFASIDPALFDELVEKHAPTEEEIAAAAELGQGRPRYGKTLRPVLVAACCTFPGFRSPEEAEHLIWGGGWHLTATEAEDLFLLAIVVCTGRRDVTDWGKDFARTSA